MYLIYLKLLFLLKSKPTLRSGYLVVLTSMMLLCQTPSAMVVNLWGRFAVVMLVVLVLLTWRQIFINVKLQWVVLVSMAAIPQIIISKKL